MINNSIQLAKEIKKFIKSNCFIKDGWIKIYEREGDNPSFESDIHSYIADSNTINWEEPFSDIINNNYKYPVGDLNGNTQLKASILVVDIEDIRDGSIYPELNQCIKIKMRLVEERNKNSNILYNRVNSDNSMEKSLIKEGNSFSVRWLDINNILENEEVLILYFDVEFKCEKNIFNALKNSVKTKKFHKNSIIYERTVCKDRTLVRILGKKIIKKSVLKN